MTPHNQAKKGDIASVVLMPGDPLRAKYIADTYLSRSHCFNTVRNMYGYTGRYKGVSLSVMGSGMGMPSIGIYSYELYTQYDVQCIIRIGTCGGYTKALHTFDTIVADSSWSPSSFAEEQSGDTDRIQYPTRQTFDTIVECARKLSIPIHIGRLHSSDVFYYEPEIEHGAVSHGCIAVEMESFALFHNAKITHKKAACICTVSDSFVYDENTTPSQRERSFDQMIRLALESGRQQVCMM